jgi:hypothetical protein
MSKTRTANPPTSQTPDAELIELGHQHDLIAQRHAAAVARFRPKWDEHRQLMKDWKSDNPGLSSEEYMAAYNRIANEIGLTAMEESGLHPDDLLEESEPIARAILAIPAITVAGLSVKARLARFGADGLWDENDGAADWSDLLVRNVIDAVVHVAASESR